MKKRTKVGLGLAVALVVAAGATVTLRGDDGTREVKTVTATRADIVDQALAVGQIEPEVEISVKSQVSGVVKRLHADVGDHVRRGTPLLEVQPNPTPQQLVEARRQVELRESRLPYLEREFERMRELREQGIVTAQEFEEAEQRFEQARIEVQLAKDQLALLEEGRVRSAGGDVETVITSPIDGFILEKNVEVGDPVVPLTPSQEGTVLISMAEMENLIFRGTVDEIDVGRLREGMAAEIKIGALPEAAISGRLERISLKARKEENSTVFPVEISVSAAEGAVLRAGFSANSEIIIERRDSVLSIPERVVTFEGDSAWVNVLRDDGTTERRTVRTGLSDAVTVEILEGLAEGEEVVEPAPREIS